MDSITQGLLGAVTFAIVKDKEIGKKSLLIGAVAGTIPDLDVFLAPFFNDIEFLSVHRSVSHSIILAVLLSLGLGVLFHSLYKKKQSQSSWIFAFFLAIMTHSILDWCTTYGTKLLSPFSARLFSTNNIHVFEPCYTLILLIGVLLLVFRNRKAFNRQRILNFTLAFSSMYLMWTFVSKGIANQHFVNELQKQNIPYTQLIVSPTPLNSLLWHGIAKSEDGYYFATHSLLDKNETTNFYFETSEHALIDKIKGNRLVKYYLDYTQDFPLIKKDALGNVKIYAIKYGPVNVFGKPEFLYPLRFNENDMKEELIYIDKTADHKGPVKCYKSLWKRIRGI